MSKKARGKIGTIVGAGFAARGHNRDREQRILFRTNDDQPYLLVDGPWEEGQPKLPTSICS